MCSSGCAADCPCSRDHSASSTEQGPVKDLCRLKAASRHRRWWAAQWAQWACWRRQCGRAVSEVITICVLLFLHRVSQAGRPDVQYSTGQRYACPHRLPMSAAQSSHPHQQEKPVCTSERGFVCHCVRIASGDGLPGQETGRGGRWRAGRSRRGRGRSSR